MRVRTLPGPPRAPTVPIPPAWASIKPAATGVPGRRPSSAAAGAVRPAPSGVPPGTISVPMRSNPSVSERPQADAFEISFIPTPFMRQVRPFAGDRAHGSRQAPGAAPGQEVGQIEELPGRCEGLRHVFGEPEQLRRFHLGRDRASDIAQHVRGAGVDPFCLLGRTVIHPDDDVPLRIAGGADRDRIAARAYDDKRAGRVEADPAHRARRDACLPHRLANAGADRTPDVIARLLGDAARLAPEADVGLGRREHAAVGGEDTRPGAAGSNVDTYEMAGHGTLKDRRCWAG